MSQARQLFCKRCQVTKVFPFHQLSWKNLLSFSSSLGLKEQNLLHIILNSFSWLQEYICIYISIYLYISISIYLSIYPSIYLSIYLYMYIYIYIYLYIYIYVYIYIMYIYRVYRYILVDIMVKCIVLSINHEIYTFSFLNLERSQEAIVWKCNRTSEKTFIGKV